MIRLTDYILHDAAIFLTIRIIDMQDMAAQAQDLWKTNAHRREHGSLGCELPKPSIDKAEDALHMKNASQGEIPCSFQLQVSKSSSKLFTLFLLEQGIWRKKKIILEIDTQGMRLLPSGS